MDGASLMQYFQDENGHAWAYEDGVPESQVRHGLTRMTQEEVEALLNPIQSLSDLASAAMVLVNAEYTKRMGAIAEVYPLHERESWPVQLQEANLLLSYADVAPIPETVKTPWIDQCAHQRGLDRMELAARIVAKDEGYRTVSGFLTGVRQWHEDCIAMLLQDGEDAREALQGYDHLQGWEQSAPV